MLPDEAFAYSNLPLRPTGRIMSALRVLPGVRHVQEQVVPYAEAWQLHNAAAVSQEGPLWIVLGDSMAQGIGASAYDRGWPGQLASLVDPALRMVNLSVYGARVRDVLEYQWPAVAALGTPALVTVAIGANDVVWRAHRPALPGAFAELLEVLPAGSVVANLPNPYSAARQVDRLLRTRGAERGLVLADMRGPGSHNWRGKLAPDHFHPNDRGYAMMTSVFARAINGT